MSFPLNGKVHSTDLIAQIGMDAGLRFTQLVVFVEYMQARGFDTGSDGYMAEWAERFARGAAYARSDEYGRSILMEIVANKLDDHDEVETWIASQSG